ncbi:MAG: bifunctional adenosylcobinamide kinase/adenosylcobinamide-phosphate guanylyltransferase [Alphaproteobacteria bacterium]
MALHDVPGGLPLPPATLILGGARCGKSALAEAMAVASGDRLTYLATGLAVDDEMAARIAEHQARRDGWTTVEEPLAMPRALAEHAGDGCVVVVDCLSFWLANLMEAERDVARETDRLVRVLRNLPGAAILVGNEVGHDIVPVNELARRFRDANGRLNQQIAAACQRVILTVAGLPMILKKEEE